MNNPSYSVSCYLEYKAICSCMSSIIVERDLITACLWHRGICGEPLTRHCHHSLSQGGRVQISCYLEYKAICSCMSSIIVEGDLITACLWHRGICGEPLTRHCHHSLSQGGRVQISCYLEYKAIHSKNKVVKWTTLGLSNWCQKRTPQSRPKLVI